MGVRVLVMGLALAAAAAPAAADTVVVTAARMLDVERGRYLSNPQVTITDGRLTAVGRQGDPVRADARRI